MNTHGPDPDRDEREWQLQERALQEVRGGAPPSSEDLALARYRDIAHALRRPPAAALPADFAARVARIAREPVRETRLERVLVRVLVVAFALSALAALGAYGGRLLEMLQSATDAGALNWGLGLAACLGLSWSLERMRVRSHRDGGAQRAA